VRHARCRYCCVLLNAHRNDLLKHARSAKHASNITFGRPYADSELTGEAVARSAMQLKLEKKKRLAQKQSRFSEHLVLRAVLYAPANQAICQCPIASMYMVGQKKSEPQMLYT